MTEQTTQPLPPDLVEVIATLRAARTDGNDSSVLQVLALLRQRAHRNLPQHAPLRRIIDSEDLVQDTLLDLIAAVDDFRGRTWPEFFAFVHAILTQRTVRQQRHALVRHAELRPSADASDDHLPGNAVTPSLDMSRAEDRARLRQLIDELPTDHRQVLRMRLDGLDNQAISRSLAISDDAVRQRFSRALGMLRDRW